MNLDDFGRWARGSGLEAVLFATGAVLLARFTRWVTGRLSVRAQRNEERDEEHDLVASEKSKRQRALVQVVAWSSVALIYFVAGLMILQRFNVPLTSLVAPAAVAGTAIGFGAQRIVQDLLSGFFIFAERQYGYGDVIRIAQPGDTQGIAGTVEEETLRTTKLRTDTGELVVIPNGEIRQVTNLSKDWARVVLDIPLGSETDVAKATEILHRIGEEMSADDDWSPMLLDQPSVMGIENFSVGFLQLRFVARTLPGKQWTIGRELRRRIAAAFAEANIVAPPTLVAAAEPARP